MFYRCFSLYGVFTTLFLGFFVVQMKIFLIIFLNPLRSLDFIDFFTLYYFNFFYLFCCLFNIKLYL